MTTFTDEKKEGAIKISNWFVSIAVKYFSYLDNSSIPVDASHALLDLKSFDFDFDSVEKFIDSLECILEGMPAAFDDKIMRAKIYYSESKVAEFEKAKEIYIGNLKKIIPRDQALVKC